MYACVTISFLSSRLRFYFLQLNWAFFRVALVVVEVFACVPDQQKTKVLSLNDEKLA